MPTTPTSTGRRDAPWPSRDRTELADTTHDPDRLAAWTDFHREVEALPAEEREVFDLLFYQGLSQAEAAARAVRSSEMHDQAPLAGGADATGPDPGREMPGL